MNIKKVINFSVITVFVCNIIFIMSQYFFDMDTSLDDFGIIEFGSFQNILLIIISLLSPFIGWNMKRAEIDMSNLLKLFLVNLFISIFLIIILRSEYIIAVNVIPGSFLAIVVFYFLRKVKDKFIYS